MQKNCRYLTGVSLYREGEKVKETLSRAGAEAYQAKEGGRNKVVPISRVFGLSPA